MLQDIIKPTINNLLIRPSTPFLNIPLNKFISPSDAINDHMLLPGLSVKNVKDYEKSFNNIKYKSVK